MFVSHTCYVMATASLSPRWLLILPQCSVTPLRAGTARLQDTGFRDNKFSQVGSLASFNRWCQSGSHNTIRVTAWLGHTVWTGWLWTDSSRGQSKYPGNGLYSLPCPLSVACPTIPLRDIITVLALCCRQRSATGRPSVT